MTKYYNLKGPQRRRHRRLLRKIQGKRVLYARAEVEFRMIERLHQAGLVTACISKWNWMDTGKRPFRELAVFATEAAARQHYDHQLPR